MGQQQLGILADRALPHRGQWEWQWRGATGQRAEDALLVDLGASFRERQDLGVPDAGRGVARNLDRPSRPRFAGCSRSPGSHSEPGDAGAHVGLPQTSHTTRHLHHTTQTAGLGRLAHVDVGDGRNCNVHTVGNGVIAVSCDASTTSSTAQTNSESKRCRPPSSTSCCVAAPRRLELERAGSRARGRDANDAPRTPEVASNQAVGGNSAKSCAGR